MRVLFVTTDAYPNFGTTVNILKKLFFDGELEQKTDEICVFSFKSSIDEPDYEIIDNVKIYRAMSWLRLSIRGSYSQLSAVDRVKVSFEKVWQRIKYHRYGHNSYPFIAKENVNALCREMLRINADSFDYIIPIFGCHDAPAAVLKYKPKHAKIVLYQVDPCSTNWTLDKRDYKKALKFEMDMYRNASAVLTMPVIYNDVQHIIPEDWKKKFYPIELPLVTRPPEYEVQQAENSKIKCVFSGLIYLGIRDPSYTLKLFRTLIESGKVSLHMVGVRKEELPEIYQDMDVVCYGRVPADKAQQVMNEADVLVNIGNLMTNQIPSKIFDYASQGKPILNICKNANCPTLPYMEKYPLALSLMEDDSQFEDQLTRLKDFLETKSKDRLSFEEVEKTFKSATPAYCANWLRDLLNQLKTDNS